MGCSIHVQRERKVSQRTQSITEDWQMSWGWGQVQDTSWEVGGSITDPNLPSSSVKPKGQVLVGV